eukprot:SAG11_NODE_201_length_12551_cov_67.866126_11_plen_263_part_00
MDEGTPATPTQLRLTQRLARRAGQLPLLSGLHRAGPGLLCVPQPALIHFAFNADGAGLDWRYTEPALPVSSGRLIAAVTTSASSPPPSRADALRHNLASQGCDAGVIDAIIDHNWAAKTASGHDSAWRQWERHCAERLDSTRLDNPTAADLVNFLQRVRAGDFSDKDVDVFSAEWVRKVRSTVSITVSMWSSAGARIGEHPLVSAFIQSLMNDDLTNRNRRRYRYDDTWNVQTVFDYVRDVLNSADFAALRTSSPTCYVTRL